MSYPEKLPAEYKPSLAIVSSHNICCALAYYAEALLEFLSPSFNVKIIDLQTTQLLRQDGEHYQKISDNHINQIVSELQEFDIVNVHLELGIYGTNPELIKSRILKICRASKRLILTVHTIDYKSTGGHAQLYRDIIENIKNRPTSNPWHLITHLPKENFLLRKHFQISSVTDFPLIYLSNKRRKFFLQNQNRDHWKKQFSLSPEDQTIGVFGLLSMHKNYLHALQTLRLLPKKYKLIIIGEAHHMSVKEMKIDPVILQITDYLDTHPDLASRVIFTGKRADAKYYDDLVNVDFVLLSSFEVGQSGSATFSNALELGCAILKSNTSNAVEYEKYFPECFEIFDIGNHYETRDKILSYDKQKIENIKYRANLFSEEQIRKIYINIYELMKNCTPITLSAPETTQITTSAIHSSKSIHNRIIHSKFTKIIYNQLPESLQSTLRTIKRRLVKN